MRIILDNYNCVSNLIREGNCDETFAENIEKLHAGHKKKRKQKQFDISNFSKPIFRKIDFSSSRYPFDNLKRYTGAVTLRFSPDKLTEKSGNARTNGDGKDCEIVI